MESGEDTQNFLEPSILHMHPAHTFYLPSMGGRGRSAEKLLYRQCPR